MSKLYFKYGVMGSAKSAEALITAHRYITQNKNPLLLTSSLDDRYKSGYIKSRAINEPMTAITIDNSTIIRKIIKNNKIDVIIADEAQFFTKDQILELMIIAKMKNIPIICYGLRTDFKGDLFEGSKWLLAWADEITEIPTICKCGKKARMVIRKVNGITTFVGEQIQIGDVEYESVCGKCFIIEKMKGVDLSDFN